MQKHTFRSVLLPTALFAALSMMSPHALAQCCPGGGGAPKSASGLGQSHPMATDLASDPNWQIYKFERGGIDYIQINDALGNVRAAVGQVDDFFWVIPMGRDVDRVSVDTAPMLQGPRKILYRSNDVEVALHRTATGDYWEVGEPDAAH